MEILEDIYIKDLALITQNDLIIADTHIGYEEALNKQGILIPRFQFKGIIERLGKIVANKKFDKIIINGDVKHEFGAISDTEWRHTLGLLDFLKDHCNKIILVKGNHDTILGPIAKKRNIRIVEHYIKDNMLIIHGDKIPNKKVLAKIKTIIIAHEHPAISLKEGLRVELFKCFLKGMYNSKNLIVQPSFNLVYEGTDILKEKLLSPFLLQNFDKFEVFIVADKVYKFGRLGRLG